MIYLGGYGSAGIGVADLTGAGALDITATVDCPDDPSYLAVSPAGAGGPGTLYAIHETDEGKVSAFSLADPAQPRPLGVWPSGGSQPCFVSVHPGGRFLMAAHWGSGTLSVLRTDPDGAVGELADVVEYRQPHAHMVVPSPDGRYVMAVHLGLDLVDTYVLDDDSGRLERRHRLRLPEGTGPRHLAFHPHEPMVYVANELASSVTACRYDPRSGRLEAAETVSTLPPDVTMENHPSAIRVSADGRFVYVANRFHDSVAVFATGTKLRLVRTYPCGASFPRDAQFTVDGRWLLVANERGNLLTTLAVDEATGALRLVGTGTAMPAPTCVVPIG